MLRTSVEAGALALLLCAYPAAGQTSAVPNSAGAATSASTPVAPGTPLPTGLQQELQVMLQAMVGDPAVSRAHWGIAVTALDGTPIAAVNDGQLFQPASNAKLYTTAAAMALLGPESTIDTVVTGAFDVGSGTVSGDLTLVGSGDANFDSGDLPYIPPALRPKAVPHPPTPSGVGALKDINSLADQLFARGVKRVDGDIVGDDTLFPWEPYAPNWALDDTVWGFGAPVAALTIADNQLRFTMRAGPHAGDPGTATLEQAIPYYSIRGEVRTVASKAEATGMQVERLPGSRVLRIYGSMAAGAEADVEEVAIDDPAEYAAMALRAALIERGIAVKGTARAKHREAVDATGYLTAVKAQDTIQERVVLGENWAADCLGTAPEPGVTVLASHKSERLSADVVLTNKISQNLHAELLLHRLGLKAPCSQGSAVEGARMVRSFLQFKAGIDPHEFVFYDGSGLSGHDLTTPHATAKLLSYAAHDPASGQPQPWFAGWRASLPVAGEDGSLAGRFKDPPLKDHVFAKTGTLSEARALSGYLDCASGRTVIFSIMVGDFVPGTAAVRETLDHIVATIAASL